jgi:hypothetical protein
VDDLILRYRQWPGIQVGQDKAFARARSPEDPKERWVDGTPENSFFVEGLAELFPEARFIHLVRDFKAVVRSLCGFHRIGGRRHDPSEACRRWIRHAKACAEAEKKLGSQRVLRVLNRELAADPEGLVRACLDFVGEEFTPDCLLPLNQRINSSGSGEEYIHAWKDADPRLLLEAEELERALLGDPEGRGSGRAAGGRDQGFVTITGGSHG